MISNIAGMLPVKQTYYADVAYGTHERQIMDVCFPESPDEIEGVVVFIHGGAWIQGDKASFKTRVKSVASKVGCVAATMNYRYISEDVDCVDILKDINNALAKIKSMCETRGITCDKVMLVGASAGAHLSLLYSYTQKANAPIEPCAVAAYSAPSDISTDRFIVDSTLLPVDKTIQLLSKLTGTDLFKLSDSQMRAVLYKFSPIKYVTSSCVPTLIVHGTKDTIVPIEDTYRMVEKLKNKGVTYSFIEFGDSGHSLDNDTYLMDKSDKVFVDFINMYIK